MDPGPPFTAGTTATRLAVPGALLRATHPGPALAVTLLATAYAAGVGLAPARTVLVAAAVLTGQLSIGWCNDLVDRHRDRAVGRTDKPLATGELPVRAAVAACAAAVALTVLLSLACGLLAGAVHLLVVAAGWAYDLGMKATVWSWAPYAVAFGALPAFVDLAEVAGAASGALPPWWVPVAGALLGVGAHLVNVVPDLDDDAATGVRGLGHALGARRATVGAVLALAAASVVVTAGADDTPVVARAAAVLAVAALVALALAGRGRTPFRAAIGIAAVDVLLLVLAA